MGVTKFVIGQEAHGERPHVQSGDFRLGGQAGGEEKSDWGFFLGGFFGGGGATCGVWRRAWLLTRRVSGRG